MIDIKIGNKTIIPLIKLLGLMNLSCWNIQPLKASEPIVSTLLGIVIEVKLVQLRKA